MAINGPVAQSKKPNTARRCLFGPPDHERIRKDLDRALSEMDRSTKAELKQRWGFDVDTETGVPEGRYEYTTVKDSDYVPSFYRKVYKTRTRRVTPRVSSGTQVDIATSTSTSSTQTVQDTSMSPAAPRTIITGVRKLDFKENCVSAGSTTRSSRSVRSSPLPPSMLQSTMTDHFQPRKRRSPEISIETSLPRGKTPRL